MTELHDGPAGAEHFGGQLRAFTDRVENETVPGSLDGLFARHVLGEGASVRWRVEPQLDEWLTVNAGRAEAASALAVLGYVVDLRPACLPEVSEVLVHGLERMAGRDPYPGDRITPMYSAGIVLGLHLAARAVHDRVPGFVAWLRKSFSHPLREPNDLWIDLMHRHVLAELTGEPARLPELAGMTDNALAAAFYLLASGTGVTRDTPEELRAARRRAMHVFLRADPALLEVRHAALWLHFAEAVAAASADQLVVSVPQVSQVLRRFPPAMKRWVWDPDHHKDPKRWRVDAEREVQAILWIMLRAVFDDVVDEEHLPKLGHSAYRADFALPKLGLLVEVKYVRTKSHFKEAEQEVIIDSVGYLKDSERYKEIIVFIYDDSCSTEHHDETRRAMLDLPGIADVIIVSRPGAIPSARERSALLPPSSPTP
ncbi:hypothetical protein JNUCC0626_47440 [Lentzea sp. JNUCC 0626]|uniref:PD-(D/E)XK nuclease domain-containing protein n=1 Tax=Lentzea sp. JNUCC 0626 TaxID=3367513 RepID=UPI0037498549